METMTNEMRERTMRVANVAWQQLIATTGMNVVSSWGVEHLGYTLFGEKKQLPSLIFTVNGLLFKGKIVIALDEGSDYYQIYSMKDGRIESVASDVCFDEMGDIIDEYVERGSCSEEEYQKMVKGEIRKLMFS